MPHHAVIGAHRQAIYMPATRHGFPSQRLTKALGASQRFNRARHLGDGSHIGAKYAAGGQSPGALLHVLPGRQHV